MSTQGKSTVDLDQIAKLASHQMDLKKVPPEFIGNISESVIAEDKQKNQCLYLTIRYEGTEGEDEQLIKQKFTATSIPVVVEKFKELGFSTIPLETVMFKWRQTSGIGRAVFPRWLPIEVTSAEEPDEAPEVTTQPRKKK